MISREAAVAAVRNSKGRFTAVKFVKRSTGEVRHMVFRLGVKKHVKGTGAAYSFQDKNLISVWDAWKREYRAIPIEGITHVKIQGKWEEVEQ